MSRLFVLLLVVAGGCNGLSVKTAGESCVASSECGTGLLCDSGTHKCAGKGTGVEVDAPASMIDAPVTHVDAPVVHVDARPIDAPPIDAPPTDAPAADAPP